MTTATDTFDQVSFTLNDQPVTASSGETILQAARRSGVDIPHLCYADGLATAGNCRACVVEIDGERVLAPSCCRAPTEGMKVSSNTVRARRSQSLVLELLRGEVGEVSHTNESELDHWCDQYDLAQSRFGGRHQPKGDLSHPAIAVNMESCIQCTRCVRACREEQNNDVIGLAFRGAHAQIVFDLGDDMGASSCVGCGECVQACPTGALMPAGEVGLKQIDKKVDSVCPYCGVGCLLTYHVKDNGIQFVTGRNGPANKGRLCVKGRYGFDYVSHPDRLTQPMIRKEGVPKGLNEFFDPTDPSKMFRSATWVLKQSKTLPARRGWQDSVRPRAPTKRPTSFRSWFAPDSAPIMSTIAQGCVMHHRWQPCLRESDQERYRIRWKMLRMPK